MRISYLWLKDFLNFQLSPFQVADIVTMAGLEVEGVAPVGPELEGIVVGHVLEARKHPNADKLSLCRVDLGDKTLEVVCGAPNVATGQKVAVIEAGTTLPDGRLIEARPVRGVVSHGMICSGRELMLSEDAEGILVLDPSLTPGALLRDVIGPRDWSLDLEITLNRPDCLSHQGVAREIAAALRVPLKLQKTVVDESGPPVDALTSIEVREPELCPRYSARLIRGVKIGPSPDWMRWRLEAAGLRSINNVVDVTNYVLLEMGHPMHAFDFQRLEGRRIVVRRAETGEKFTTLDGQERILDDRMLLICDAQRGVALAGVMGGSNSEITEETTDLLLESAYFDPINTRRTSRLLGLSTDSSKRFERGADPNATVRALDRAAELILQLAGGEVAQGVADVYPRAIEPPRIDLRPARVQEILGLKVPKVEISDHLVRLGCQVAINEPAHSLTVRPPTWRPDLEREIDLIEEVARLHGYDHIPTAEQARSPLNVPHVAADAFPERLADLLTREGFTQVYTSSLLSAREVEIPGYPAAARIKNPASEDTAYLRNGLLPGLLKVAAYNLHRGQPDLALFEIGRVFAAGDDGLREWDALTGLLAGARNAGLWDQPEQAVDFLDLKGHVQTMLSEILLDKPELFYYHIEHGTGDALEVRRGERSLGWLEQVHPAVAARFEVDVPVFAFEFSLPELAEASPGRLVYRPFSKFPSLQRDLAFVLPEEAAVGPLLEEIRSAGGPHLAGTELFDVYRGVQAGPGMKSIAVRLAFQSPERTLTDAEADAAVEAIVTMMAQAHGARLRS
ncbi:MAG: phenylalanine--tRNA ligase subunit beta [Candidatus Zixiibacteriota bacterium]|nr:MAG: phenylalanine--tRNA ligase subunit beta [candidate division Zixibacteria bacterium]